MMRYWKVCAVSFVSIFMVGCVGMGVTASPADGRFSIDFQARDCITDNVAGRTISAIPVVGDWAMLNWGCNTAEPMVGE
jgi:hypothetical protein